jgi:NitT/TauT family transport system ATP-binding protein
MSLLEQTQIRTDPLVRLENVAKQYGSGSSALLALDRVSLTVRQGEFVCLLGASGCGWTPAASCWSTRRTCGRAGSSSPPT